MKTVLCGHEHLSKEFDKNMKSEYNCYKLFGFDVFIDQDLKPWIIEVWQQKSITIFRAGHASFVPRPCVTRETVKLSLLQRSKFRRG